MSALTRFWAKTNQYFITGGVMSLGDGVSQLVIEKKDNIDWTRNARFAALGLLFVGPTLHNWFKFLDRKFVGNSGLAPFKKVVVDQSLMAPSLNTSILVLLEVMQRKKWSDIEQKLKCNLPSILVTQYKLWPAVQLINFYLVPLNRRLLVVVIVAFFWNIYLANALQSTASTHE